MYDGEQQNAPVWRWSDDPDDPQQVYVSRGVLDEPVAEALGLDDLAVRALRVADVVKVADVCALSSRDLTNVRDLSADAAEMISVALTRLGLSLASDDDSSSFTPGAKEGHGQGALSAEVWAVEVGRELHDDLMWWPFVQVSCAYVRDRLRYLHDAADPTWEKALRDAVEQVSESLEGDLVATRVIAVALCDALGGFLHPDQVVACRPI